MGARKRKSGICIVSFALEFEVWGLVEDLDSCAATGLRVFRPIALEETRWNNLYL